jgi:hypothetical protein
MTRTEIYEYAIGEMREGIERLHGRKLSQQELEEIIDDLILSRLDPEVLRVLMPETVGDLYDCYLAENPWTKEAERWLRSHHTEFDQLTRSIYVRALHIYGERHGQEMVKHLATETYPNLTEVRKEFLFNIWSSQTKIVNDPKKRAEFLQIDSDN